MFIGFRVIHPTSTAPYALRFVTDDFSVGDAGAYAVDYRYNLGAQVYEERLTRYDGKHWRWIATARTGFRRVDEGPMKVSAANLVRTFAQTEEPA